MVETLLNYLIIYGLQTNLVVYNSSGLLVFQREKVYTSYRVISTLFLILGVIISATATFFLNMFLYSKFNLYNISVTVNVVIVCLYNIFVSKIFTKSKKFNNYLYENSFSYAYDVVFTLSILFMLDYNLSIVYFFMSLAAAVVVIFVTSFIIGFFVKSCNRNFINNSIANVPARLFMFAIFAIIFYYACELGIKIG